MIELKLYRWFSNGTPAKTIYDIQNLEEAQRQAEWFASYQIGTSGIEAAEFGATIQYVGIVYSGPRGIAVRVGRDG